MLNSLHFYWTQFKNTITYIENTITSIELFRIVQIYFHWWGHASYEKCCPIWRSPAILHATGPPSLEAIKYKRNRARTAKEIKFKHSNTTPYKNTVYKVSALHNPFLMDSKHKISYLIKCTPNRFIAKSQTHISSTILLLHKTKSRWLCYIFSWLLHLSHWYRDFGPQMRKR